MAAAFADNFRELLLIVSEALNEIAIARRFFNGIQVLPLNVFDDREFDEFFIGQITHDNRHTVQAGFQRCPPTPFACDDFEIAIAAWIRPHDDRLH